MKISKLVVFFSILFSVAFTSTSYAANVCKPKNVEELRTLLLGFEYPDGEWVYKEGLQTWSGGMKASFEVNDDNELMMVQNSTVWDEESQSSVWIPQQKYVITLTKKNRFEWGKGRGLLAKVKLQKNCQLKGTITVKVTSKLYYYEPIVVTKD